MPTPYSLKIFLPDGNPDGMRTIEKSNWSGQGFVFPRALISEASKRKELNRTGVYILKGDDENSSFPKIYIGEGDPVLGRLRNHALNKDFWTICFTFSSKDESLNKAHIQYIESRLVKLASKGKRCTLENGNIPDQPSLSEADRADAQIFLQEMLLCFPVLGLGMFTNIEMATPISGISTPKSDALIIGEELFIVAKGADAKGVQLADGFFVKKGSKVVDKYTNSCPQRYKDMRNDLIKSSVITNDGGCLIFTQDFMFNSPSAAGCVVLASSVNGLDVWRNIDGVKLGSLQNK